jgi:hypothetical protein
MKREGSADSPQRELIRITTKPRVSKTFPEHFFEIDLISFSDLRWKYMLRLVHREVPHLLVTFIPGFLVAFFEPK